MIKDLCYTPVIEEDPRKPKSIVYKNMSDNIPDIIDSITQKYCLSDYFVTSGNSNRETAIDRFNQTEYDKKVAELDNIFIAPPGPPDD